MKRLALVTVLLLAAPAFAQSYPGDDDSWQDEAPPPQYAQPQYGQPDQYGQPPPRPPLPGEAYGEPGPNEQPYGPPPGYGQPSEPIGYEPPDSGPTYADFRADVSLASAGIWVETPDYGLVWRPTRVNPDWQPYLYGHWAYTVAGWAWISDEPFGWATYHYGRWAVLGDGGWAWLPGRVWAPAWVAWRYDNGYSAWCPLGPRGIVYERPREWIVVDNRHFLEPAHRYVLPLERRREIVVRAPVYRGPRAGPPIVNIGRATGREVRPLVVVDGNARRPTVGGGQVTFYRPRTAPVVVNRQPAFNRHQTIDRQPLVDRPGTPGRQEAPMRNRVPQTFGERQAPAATAQPPRTIVTPQHERTAQPETVVQPQQRAPWQQQRNGQPQPGVQQRAPQPGTQQFGAQQRAPWQQPRTIQPQPGMQPNAPAQQQGAQQRAGQPQQRPGQPQQRAGQPQQVRPRPVVVQPNRRDDEKK